MTPHHLAVIPDGNRRWAKERGLSVREGHAAGIANMGPLAAHAWGAGVSCFTFWWGSPANLLRRDRSEVDDIVDVLNRWLVDEAPALLRAHDARFHVLGRYEELAPGIAEGVAACVEAAGSGPRQLALLMAYDGREDLLQAAEGGRDGLEERLWTAVLPPVDLVLRTGGEPHLSAGFLLWQIAEAQLAFTETLWPALSTEELTEILSRRPRRRFGA